MCRFQPDRRLLGSWTGLGTINRLRAWGERGRAVNFNGHGYPTKFQTLGARSCAVYWAPQKSPAVSPFASNRRIPPGRKSNGGQWPALPRPMLRGRKPEWHCQLPAGGRGAPEAEAGTHRQSTWCIKDDKPTIRTEPRSNALTQLICEAQTGVSWFIPTEPLANEKPLRPASDCSRFASACRSDTGGRATASGPQTMDRLTGR